MNTEEAALKVEMSTTPYSSAPRPSAAPFLTSPIYEALNRQHWAARKTDALLFHYTGSNV